MSLPLHRSGTSPLLSAFFLLPLTLCYTGCRQSDPEGDKAAQYGVPKQHCEYCELKPVLQEIDPTGGLSALTSVMRYWDAEVDEAQLAEKYPTKTPEAGYSIRKLRRIAIDEGMTAFALTMREKSLDQISEQLASGRPVIVNIELGSEGYPDLQATAPTEPQKRYAIVFGQSNDQFLMMDTGHGVIRIGKTAFETMWAKGHHTALIVSAN